MNFIKFLEKWENSRLEFKEDISHPDSIAWEIGKFFKYRMMNNPFLNIKGCYITMSKGNTFIWRKDC